MTKPEQMPDFVDRDIPQVCREKLYLLKKVGSHFLVSKSPEKN